jgi:hypothetical protein
MQVNKRDWPALTSILKVSLNGRQNQLNRLVDIISEIRSPQGEGIGFRYCIGDWYYDDDKKTISVQLYATNLCNAMLDVMNALEKTELAYKGDTYEYFNHETHRFEKFYFYFLFLFIFFLFLVFRAIALEV